MKNIKGLTLVEIIIAMALVSVTATVFFKVAAFGFKQTVDSNKYTVDSFAVQQDIEDEINKLKNTNDRKAETKTIFGKEIKGETVNFDIKDSTNPSSTLHGKYTAFVPRINITYDVPTITSAAIKIIGAADTVNGVSNVSVVDLPAIDKIDTSTSFEGSHVDGVKKDWLLNVYRWYITPKSQSLSGETIIKNKSDRDNFLEKNKSDFITLKEWNATRPEAPYDFINFNMVPNIKKRS